MCSTVLELQLSNSRERGRIGLLALVSCSTLKLIYGLLGGVDVFSRG